MVPARTGRRLLWRVSRKWARNARRRESTRPMIRNTKPSRIPPFSLLLFLLLSIPALSQQIVLRGRIADPQGNVLPNGSVQLVSHDQVAGQAYSGPEGTFELKVASAGQFDVKVDAPGFRPLSRSVAVHLG